MAGQPGIQTAGARVPPPKAQRVLVHRARAAPKLAPQYHWRVPARHAPAAAQEAGMLVWAMECALVWLLLRLLVCLLLRLLVHRLLQPLVRRLVCPLVSLTPAAQQQAATQGFLVFFFPSLA